MVTYQISFPEPGSHLVTIRLEFTAPTSTASEDPGCTLWMAAWTPGSYLVREYARNIRTLSAEVEGQPAPVRKLRKDSWHVDARPGQPVRIDYRVYAHELSVRTAHHDASHAFLHPAQIFLIPGFGAQGGTADDVRAMVRTGKMFDEGGVLVTASRSVIYPKSSGTSWRDSIRLAARDLATQILQAVGNG